jgi:hypothetical protein
MSGPVLYSTNVFLKLFIQQEYRNDIHYIWCSEDFDSKKLSGYVRGSLVPPTSNPADIYRDLHDAVQRQDFHNAKIVAQKASLVSRAIEWEKNGDISSNEKDEIIYMVNNSPFQMWRPLLYVIPFEPVRARLQLVPINQRAGFGNEYIIPDLQRSEFDIIEF